MHGHVPGEVHWLPPEAIGGGDPKERRQVLLSACPPDTETVTFAFGSTKGTEASLGATHLVLNPFATNYRGTGFDEPTYIYLSRLFSTHVDELGQPVGQIVYELPSLLRLMGIALGLGTGTAIHGRAAGSLRGRVVQFSRELRESVGANYGIVVTEPRYSVRRRYQTIIPIVNGAEYGSTLYDIAVAASGAPWLAALELETAVLTVPDVFSAFHASRIANVLPTAVDEATMNALDEALRVHFGLWPDR